MIMIINLAIKTNFKFNRINQAFIITIIINSKIKMKNNLSTKKNKYWNNSIMIKLEKNKIKFKRHQRLEAQLEVEG